MHGFLSVIPSGNGIDIAADLDIMRKGVVEFHGVYYKVENILPKAYIEDVYLMYHFVCTEDKQTKSLLVEEPEVPEETESGGADG